MPKFNVRLCAVVRVKLAEPIEATDEVEAAKKGREMLSDEVLRDTLDRAFSRGNVDYVEYDDTVTEAIVDEVDISKDFVCLVPKGADDHGVELWEKKQDQRR